MKSGVRTVDVSVGFNHSLDQIGEGEGTKS